MLYLVGFAACCLRESRLRRRTGLLKYADKIYIPLWREVHPKAKPVKKRRVWSFCGPRKRGKDP